MSNLSNFEEVDQIKSEIRIDESGKGYSTIRGVSRIVGVDESSLRGLLTIGAGKNLSKLTELLMQQGFDLRGSFDGIPDLAVSVIIKYYAYYTDKRCPQSVKDRCKKIDLAHSGIGMRVWMRNLTGWTENNETKQSSTFLPVEQRVSNSLDNAERYIKLFGNMNPSIEQCFKDSVANILMESNQRLLSASKEEWRGVVSVAEDMGYNVPQKGEYRRQSLGMWIRWFSPELTEKQERRLCNETQQSIWVYPVHDSLVEVELKRQINLFFAHPNPSSELVNLGAFKCNRAA